MLGDLPVGEHQPPHDFGEHHLLTRVVVPLELRCELEVVDRVLSLILGQLEKLSTCLGWQGKMPLQNGLEVAVLCFRELAIRKGYVEE